jgi:hypothetical protein
LVGGIFHRHWYWFGENNQFAEGVGRGRDSDDLSLGEIVGNLGFRFRLRWGVHRFGRRLDWAGFALKGVIGGRVRHWGGGSGNFHRYRLGRGGRWWWWRRWLSLEGDDGVGFLSLSLFLFQ